MREHRRSLSDLWKLWRPAARKSSAMFKFTDYEVVERVMTGLPSYDPEVWARAFSAEAEPHEAAARVAEAAGDELVAKESYLRAYAYNRIARYPTTSSPSKKASYLKSVEMFLGAAAFFEPALQRVAIPFRGRAGEGDAVIAYLRLPKATTRQSTAGASPVVVHWCGTDTWKEECIRSGEVFLERGLALLLIDMPGTGEAPVVGSLDADRMFDAVLDWIGTRAELDASRVCLFGGSFGGYWAVKMAHTRSERVRCVVNQGGGAHYNFQPEWHAKIELGEYPFDPLETRAHCFGLSSVEEWLELAPRLSLLRMGLLDRRCAPLLLVNGIHDTITPMEDFYLLFRHGDPKEARFYPAGHMGLTPTTMPTIADWVSTRLS